MIIVIKGRLRFIFCFRYVLKVVWWDGADDIPNAAKEHAGEMLVSLQAVAKNSLWWSAVGQGGLGVKNTSGRQSRLSAK